MPEKLLSNASIFEGAVGFTIITQTNFVLSPNQKYGVKPSLGNLNPILPPLLSVPEGRMIEVQDLEFGAATTNVTINTSGSDEIIYQDAAPVASLSLAQNGVCLRFVSMTTYWRVFYYGN